MEASARGRRTRLRLVLEVIALILFIFVGLALILPSTFSSLFHPRARVTEDLKEAMYYTKLKGKTLQCQLCYRRCVIRNGQRGFCKNRRNIGGELFTLVYEKPSGIQIDPIEKEPLYHVLPGSRTFCIGTAGCNFRCSFCHNWHMAHKSVEEVDYFEYSPEELVKIALDRDCSGFHFTYNEPTVFYEYMYDIAKIAKENGLTTAFHSNGAMNPEPLRELLRYMDAVTIDLKSFSNDFYHYVTEEPVESSQPLDTVLNNLKIIKEEGTWLEVVNLVIPTLNDDMDEIREMCVWIRNNLGENTPLHFSRFFPACTLTKLPPTPVRNLEEARDMALEEGLRYIYIGNVPGHQANSLFCPQCGESLIARFHFIVLQNNLKEGNCMFCGYKIPGIWS